MYQDKDRKFKLGVGDYLQTQRKIKTIHNINTNSINKNNIKFNYKKAKQNFRFIRKQNKKN